MQSRPARAYLGIAAETLHPGRRPGVQFARVRVNTMVEIHADDPRIVEHVPDASYSARHGDFLVGVLRVWPFAAPGFAYLRRRVLECPPGRRGVRTCPPEGGGVDRHLVRLPLLRVIQEHEANPIF